MRYDDRREFEFYGESVFPEVFDGYKNLKDNLAQMVDSAGNEIVVEIDAENGVLSNLIESERVEKFYLIADNVKNRAIDFNLSNSKRSYQVFSKISKCLKHFEYIMSSLEKDKRNASVVFQAINMPLSSDDRKRSKMR